MRQCEMHRKEGRKGTLSAALPSPLLRFAVTDLASVLDAIDGDFSAGVASRQNGRQTLVCQRRLTGFLDRGRARGEFDDRTRALTRDFCYRSLDAMNWRYVLSLFS